LDKSFNGRLRVQHGDYIGWTSEDAYRSLASPEFGSFTDMQKLGTELEAMNKQLVKLAANAESREKSQVDEKSASRGWFTRIGKYGCLAGLAGLCGYATWGFLAKQ
jgi:hypothetical protein